MAATLANNIRKNCAHYYVGNSKSGRAAEHVDKSHPLIRALSPRVFNVPHRVSHKFYAQRTRQRGHKRINNAWHDDVYIYAG